MKRIFVLAALMGFLPLAMAQNRTITLWGTAHLGADAFESNDPCRVAHMEVEKRVRDGNNPDGVVFAQEEVSPAERSRKLQQIEDEHLRNYIGFYQNLRTFSYYFLTLLHNGPSLNSDQYINVWSNTLSTLMDPEDHPFTKKILDSVVKKHASEAPIGVLEKDLRYVREFFDNGERFPAWRATFPELLETLFAQQANRAVSKETLNLLVVYVDAMQFLITEGAHAYFIAYIQPQKDKYDLPVNQLPEIGPEFKSTFDFLKPEVLISDEGMQNQKIIDLTILSVRNFFIAKNIETHATAKTDDPLLIYLGKAHLRGVVSMLLASKVIPDHVLREIKVLSSIDEPKTACDPGQVMSIAADPQNNEGILKIVDWAKRNGISIPGRLVDQPSNYAIEAYGLTSQRLEKSFTLKNINDENALKFATQRYLQEQGVEVGVYVIRATSREGRQVAFKIVVVEK